MKNWIILLILAVFCSNTTFGQVAMSLPHKENQNIITKRPVSISLTGEITSVDITKGSNAYGINLKARMKLKNNSNIPILFLKKDFLFTGLELAQNSKDLQMGKSIFGNYAGMSCSQNNKEWLKLRKKLDQPIPPSDEIFTLLPNEEIIIDAEPVGLSILVDPKKGFTSVERESKSWEMVKNSPELWVKVLAESYPSWGLEQDCYEKTFGKELQKRWENLGFLWLNDIQSEPIELSLSSINK